MEVKNGIIIDGVLHELEATDISSCNICSLRNVCFERIIYDKLCDIKIKEGVMCNFVSRGKVRIEKEETK